jgi:tRNA synthetases class I (I, L, M and V)
VKVIERPKLLLTRTVLSSRCSSHFARYRERRRRRSPSGTSRERRRAPPMRELTNPKRPRRLPRPSPNSPTPPPRATRRTFRPSPWRKGVRCAACWVLFFPCRKFSHTPCTFFSNANQTPDHPGAVEAAWQDWWEASGFYSCDPKFAMQRRTQDEKFVMVIPPPNVTGSLHLGHALTAAVEDTLTRWHRMKGHATLYVPGTWKEISLFAVYGRQCMGPLGSYPSLFLCASY